MHGAHCESRPALSWDSGGITIESALSLLSEFMPADCGDWKVWNKFWELARKLLLGEMCLPMRMASLRRTPTSQSGSYSFIPASYSSSLLYGVGTSKASGCLKCLAGLSCGAKSMDDQARLIERAFPLKQASLDSVHEKNVRHGHISTLHIWPARRPLAACRAALIATLLPDPESPEKRKEILERLAGTVVEKAEKKKLPTGKIVERLKPETIGGILHWGRESNPDLEWFRQEIRKAYGGQAPKVLDPFAGGGAIPLEAMRLGCETTAIDINPVAWFILKCTLEYPQKLAGQKHPLPEFVLEDPELMQEFLEGHSTLIAHGKKLTKKQHE